MMNYITKVLNRSMNSAKIARINENIEARRQEWQDELDNATAIGWDLGNEFMYENFWDLIERMKFDGASNEPDDVAEGGYVGDLISSCFDSYSQYSPWEQQASYWNSFGEWKSAELWKAFEDAMYKQGEAKYVEMHESYVFSPKRAAVLKEQTDKQLAERIESMRAEQ